MGGCDIVACDDNKVGLGFANAFIKLIETSDTSELITTKLRRNSRCFLVTKHDQRPNHYQMLCSHLHYIGSDIVSDIPPGARLNDKEVMLRMNQLKDIFLPESSYLFLRMGSGFKNGIYNIRKKIALHFKLLSPGCSVDTFLPYKEVTRIKDFISSCRKGDTSLFDCLQHSNHAELISTSSKTSLNECPQEDVLNHL